ncbi:MAG: FHA domain-containing protein [Rhodoglobus sp.]
MALMVRSAGVEGWLAFACGSRLLVTPSSDDSFVGSVWSAMITPDGFRLVLDLLTNKGLAATPPFFLMSWEESAPPRIILRGEAPLMVKDASGTQPLSGEKISTWVERTLPGATGLTFAVPGTKALGTAALPLESGVALIAEVSIEMPALSAVPTETPLSTRAQGRKARGADTGDIDIEATVREAPETVVPGGSGVRARVLGDDAPRPETATDAEGYDHLFGDTMYRSVAQAAVRDPEAVSTESSDGGAHDDILHDGQTVLSSEVSKARGRRRPKTARPVAAPEAPTQHLVLVVSTTKAREPLSQVVLVGRSPSASKVSGSVVPRLLSVGTVDQDISRNHVQVAVEGGTVVVTDLHSRNGTLIALPGKSAQKLRAGEPTSVIIGTVIDLGSGITLTVEDDA